MKFDYRNYNFYTADFETSTEKWGEDKARVWLWDICNKKYEHNYGITLNSFMDFILKKPYKSLYGFRNLAYDGSYILEWLLKHGYKHTKNDKLKPNEFSAIITDRGSHYAYEICNINGQSAYIVDTLKTVNMSIENSAKMYNLPIKKGHINYDDIRENNHIPTKEELDYIFNDTEIDMRTIQLNMRNGGVKFTQAGNAKYEYKKIISKHDFDIYFPLLTQKEDNFMRKAYRGGYVYANPNYCNKIINGMISLDINSMYPAQMLHALMPHGAPQYFEGKYKPYKQFPLYIQKLKVIFELKPNKLPIISKRSGFLSSQNLYITSSEGKIVELTLSNPDLELFFENYETCVIEWCGGYMFNAVQGIEILPQEAEHMKKDDIINNDGRGSLFFEYIRKWRYGKEYHEGAQRDYDKRMQNALYGTFATNPKKDYSVPILYKDNKLKLEKHEGEYKPTRGEYLPVAIFVTAWARHFLISQISKHYNEFVYCDTDSLYLLNTVNLNDFNIHKTLYGYFKIEHVIEKFKCVGAKRYIYYGRKPEDSNNTLYITCCGADNDIKAQMNFDNFNLGAEFYGKKTVRQFEGGKQICVTTYKLGKIDKKRGG